MKFYIDTGDLQRIIKLLSVTAKLNTSETKGRILIEANEGNTVLFVSNNNSTAISITSNKVSVKEPGITSIVYSKIKSFVSSFKPWNETHGAKEFYFKSNDKSLSISVNNVYDNGKKSKGKLKIGLYNAFNIQKPKPFGEANFILNSNIFRTALSKVLYAIDPNEIRQFIQGMNVRFDKSNIYFAGTNGRMLSEYTIKNISNLKTGNFIFKYDFIMGLRRALGDETQLFFEIDGRSVKVQFDDVCFVGRMVIGHEFPDYNSNLEAFSNKIVLDKEILMSLLNPFIDVLDADDNNRVTFSIDDKKMSIYNDYANFDYDDGVGYDDKFIIDINGMFMIQTIDAIKDDKILLKFSDDRGCLIFDSANFNDQKALITPIRRRC